MSRTFIIVRHSERLDEVSPEEWLDSLKNNNSWRDKYSIENDTPITANGATIAADAAKTVKSIIETRLRNTESTKDLKIRIYSSRLMRCVQTANQIAQELNLPIHVSTGLALTAVAVGRRKTTFEFQTLEELSELCPDVELHCSDSEDVNFPVCKTDWLNAIEDIINRDEVNIIVAHRETIRNLIGERMKLPYCCIGMFLYHNQKILPHYLWDKDGRLIVDYLLPTEDNTTINAINNDNNSIISNDNIVMNVTGIY